MSKETFKNILLSFCHMKETINFPLALNDYSVLLNQMFEEKETKIEVLERALEFACKRYWDDCGMEDCPYGENESFDANNKKCQSCSDNSGMTENKDGCCWVEFFKSQAESDIKNEKE